MTPDSSNMHWECVLEFLSDAYLSNEQFPSWLGRDPSNDFNPTHVCSEVKQIPASNNHNRNTGRLAKKLQGLQIIVLDRCKAQATFYGHFF
mmetsp:Transcript_33676/g.68405  ORF Transcript_33676/g.68405 Transcript_33676/m.68405 type:complete len:91 (-) Transcript_33676:1265-1537(-)